jgi:hypothetical protein
VGVAGLSADAAFPPPVVAAAMELPGSGIKSNSSTYETYIWFASYITYMIEALFPDSPGPARNGRCGPAREVGSAAVQRGVDEEVGDTADEEEHEEHEQEKKRRRSRSRR